MSCRTSLHASNRSPPWARSAIVCVACGANIAKPSPSEHGDSYLPRALRSLLRSRAHCRTRLLVSKKEGARTDAIHAGGCQSAPLELCRNDPDEHDCRAAELHFVQSRSQPADQELYVW